MIRASLIALSMLCVLAGNAAADTSVRVSHGLSLFGELKYPPDFQHLDYVNPDAPKGGLVTLSAIGTFDSLNPFIIKGTPAAGAGLIYDSLLEPAADEPSSEYGLLAESVEVPEDLSWVAFNLRKEARWHDGKPVTPEDVVFSFNILKEKGAPFYRFYYANVAKAEKIGPNKVRFSFTGPKNRELPLIVGQLPILPKHYWEGREFDATTLEPPLGSGPYRIAQAVPGRSITLELVEDYWGRDLPINKGRNNFGRIRFEYYRDPTVALEAFKAGAYDFRQENSAKAWATAYGFPAVQSGLVVTAEPPDNTPAGMQAFVFNTRRDKFKDPRVRQALAYAFDFEWSNRNLFYGQYTRTDSYFENSELEATGLPSEAELKLLEPLRGQVPDQVFTEDYTPPNTTHSDIRKSLRTALKLLREAGWEVKNGRLTNVKTNQPMTIEFLIVSPDFERVIAPMIRNLERLGIDADIRLVDSSQYVNRVDRFQFDVVVNTWPESLSPGNEQRDFWGSEAAGREGSRNLAGISDPAIDKLIDHVIFAGSREELVAACRALDRVLLWHHFVIPNWHNRVYRIAYWNRFGKPETMPKYALGFFDTWWVEQAKDRNVQAQRPAKTDR